MVSRSDNKRNVKRGARKTSGVTGVHWFNAANKWRAQISAAGRYVYLGLFIELDAAAERERGFHSNHGRATSAS